MSASHNYLSQLGGERVPYHGRGTGLNTDISAASGHFGYDVDATTDTNFRNDSGERKHSGGRVNDFEMRSQLLDEKEKRLTIQETLTKTKEEKLSYRSEIEALRAELRKRPLLNTTDKRAVTQVSVNHLQEQIDALEDENVTLKLKISDMETDLIDERHKKKVNYDVTLESIKATTQE